MIMVSCRISRFPRLKFLHMYRVSDHAESALTSRINDVYSVAFQCFRPRRHSDFSLFEAQYLTCVYHCLTLRV